MKKFVLLMIFTLTTAFTFGQSAEISYDLPQTVEAGDSFTAVITYDIEKGFHQVPIPQFFFFLVEGENIEMGEIIYPQGEEFSGKVSLSAPVTISSNAPEGPLSLQITAGYQLCDEKGTCFPPSSESFSEKLEITSLQGGSEGNSSILLFLLLALIGGLLLNIMPCVLPLLSVKAMGLINQSGDSKKDLIKNSMAYTAGIEFSMIVLALIVIGVKASGELIGWGFQFQNPSFVLVLIGLLVVFTLSLFDVFTFEAPGIMAPAQGRKGLTGNFITGIFAVLVATPCTAPFLGAALGFAFSQPPLVILLIFFMIGLGLAMPFILLGFNPKIIKKLPRPGEWMNTFKELMGFLLLITVISLLNVLYHQLGGKALIDVLSFIAVLAFSCWLYGKLSPPTSTKKRKIIALLLATSISVGGGIYFLQFDREGPAVSQEEETGEWEVFSEERLNEYLEAGEPVFIDFYAEWCTTCKLNETTVLNTIQVEDYFKENDIHLLKGDFTSNDPLIAKWIAIFGKGGVPVYAFYPEGEKDPIILPELLSVNIITSLTD